MLVNYDCYIVDVCVPFPRMDRLQVPAHNRPRRSSSCPDVQTTVRFAEPCESQRESSRQTTSKPMLQPRRSSSSWITVIVRSPSSTVSTSKSSASAAQVKETESTDQVRRTQTASAYRSDGSTSCSAEGTKSAAPSDSVTELASQAATNNTKRLPRKYVQRLLCFV